MVQSVGKLMNKPFLYQHFVPLPQITAGLSLSLRVEMQTSFTNNLSIHYYKRLYNTLTAMLEPTDILLNI